MPAGRGSMAVPYEWPVSPTSGRSGLAMVLRSPLRLSDSMDDPVDVTQVVRVAGVESSAPPHGHGVDPTEHIFERNLIVVLAQLDASVLAHQKDHDRRVCWQLQRSHHAASLSF